jgi:response regulator RpfG family c-di-GMP phosphodiesterase
VPNVLVRYFGACEDRCRFLILGTRLPQYIWGTSLEPDYSKLKFAEHVDCRILVCDDALADASYLEGLLADVGYHGVSKTTDPRDAMQQLESAEFDLLLLDLNMPHLDGTAMIRTLRQTFSPAALPILVITGTDPGQTRNAALLEGANDYLNKPIDPIEMALRVRNLLSVRSSHVLSQRSHQNLEAVVASRTAKLDMLIENGLLMSATRDVSRLFQHALFEGKRLLNCDAASLYLVTKQQTIRFAMRTRDDFMPSTEISLYDPATGLANDRCIAVHVVNHRKSVRIDDVYQETHFDVSGTRAFDAHTRYRTVSLLTVPMASRDGVVTGVFQFINRLDPVSGAIVPFSPDLVSLVEALAAQAAVTYENLQLIDERRKFMEGLIQTIATAIDAKSPFTGRHSERVPELALMLARAASDSNRGTLANFSFSTDDQWHEFRVGAWLHDCGKITTPDHVIDKATKLETIYNRLHEVRTRFEVLLRDAEITRLLALQGASAADADAANAAHASRVQQLHDDFAFIAHCNLGSEGMTEAERARIIRIGQTTWLRHFDDRLGLSQEELARKSKEPACELPALELLLQDGAHHVIARDAQDLPSPSFRFKVEIPPNLYNRGELYNLLVPQGTLTHEERFKMHEHMIHGIMMLERMPFPESLKRVPEYAGTHHENLLGTGYPRGLDATQLSVPARIMVIADVFEALTASDRPYKTPKKFSEALSILHSLKKKGLIDAELFDLFLSSGVHLQYARKFLRPEQMDDIHIDDYLDSQTG